MPCVGSSSITYLPTIAKPDGSITQTLEGNGICAFVDAIPYGLLPLLAGSSFRYVDPMK